VIPPDIRFDDLDASAWRHAQRMLLPPRPPGPSSARGRGAPFLLFIEDGRCVKAIRVGARGGERVEPSEFEWAGPWSLERLRRAAKAPLAVAIEGDAMERIASAIDRSLDPSADLVAQGLDALRALRAEVGRGVHIDPDPLARVPIPSFAALQKTWDALVPDDRSIGVFVFDRDRVWASVIVEKQEGDVVRVTSHAALGIERPEMTRHREILGAMEARVARPYAALFATLDAWREIVGPDPGALARQVATRRAILEPAPPWMLALTGAGAMAGMAAEATRLFGRFVPESVKATAKAMSPFAALGFDPIELFTRFRKMFQ
jgi:aryl carrier-like protein